ncbi:MAG: hypothetical protein M0P26_05365, partial [Bacteroidales bacterium]|nr:hypothetical protein [Bacteroidales bacterium]
MKKFNGIIYCLLSLAFFSSCDSNKKLEQTDAENAVKDFVQTNSFQSDAIWGLEGYFNVNSITLIEPIIQFTDIEAYLIVHFNYHDAYTNGNMCLRFNFKRNIDKNWILTSVDSVSEVSSQIMSDKL